MDTEAQPPQAAQEQQQQRAPSLFGQAIKLFINIFVIGLVQLFCWIGLGMEDPFFPKPVTILQIVGCLASLLQIVAFIPSFALQTEKYYDFVGMITNILCILYSLLTGLHVNGFVVDVRAVLASVAYMVWALRLGYFLFKRRHRANAVDGRFTAMLPDFLRFFIVWNVQGLWVLLGGFPTFILNSTQNFAPFAATDAVGAVFFCCGLALEHLADTQKSAFNAKPENKGKWIETGLWYYTRHPNYFFEWLLQFGLFLVSVAELEGRQYIAVVSPVFIASLLWFISGVPLLEQRANQKWAGSEEYLVYRRRTSVCVPWFKLSPVYDENSVGLVRRIITADGWH